MRTQTILIAACLLAFVIKTNAQQADFNGTWEGKISVGVDLRVIFHVARNENGSFTTTTDSPDQDAFNIPCDATIVSGDSIRIEMKGMNAVYAGKLISDSAITGHLTQGFSIPLTLKRSTREANLPKRPQTPLPPFPYKSEDVEYDNADKSQHFGATITIPEGKGPFPAAVLITGSGPQDRDETISAHKIFAVLADALTRNGIVVLRVDDRGMGKSTGHFSSSTSADFAKDVNVSLDYLLTRPEVNKKKIGMIGHSEGGMIAPLVAVERKDIDFMVLLAGPGVKITQLMVEQNEAMMKSILSTRAFDAFMPYYKKLVGIVSSTTDSAMISQSMRKAADEWVAVTDTSILNELGFSEKGKQRTTSMMIEKLTTPWFRYFFAYNPQPVLEKLNSKVLALNGSKDIQVLASSNLEGIRAALKKSKSKTYTVKELPGLNHLFQTCITCTVMEYGKLEETFSPVALKEINDWLNKNVK
jgi:alpha/beta superfamily hydrolase